MADASGYRPRWAITRGTVPLRETVPEGRPAIYFIVKVLIFSGNSAGFAFAENREDSSAARNRPRSGVSPRSEAEGPVPSEYRRIRGDPLCPLLFRYFLRTLHFP